MSHVSNVILSFSVEDEELLTQINSFFNEDYPYAPLKRIDREPNAYGGSKYYEKVILLGAFNYFPISKFVQHLRDLTWRDWEEVQLFIADEHDDPHAFSERLHVDIC